MKKNIFKIYTAFALALLLTTNAPVASAQAAMGATMTTLTPGTTEVPEDNPMDFYDNLSSAQDWYGMAYFISGALDDYMPSGAEAFTGECGGGGCDRPDRIDFDDELLGFLE